MTRLALEKAQEGQGNCHTPMYTLSVYIGSIGCFRYVGRPNAVALAPAFHLRLRAARDHFSPETGSKVVAQYPKSNFANASRQVPYVAADAGTV